MSREFFVERMLKRREALKKLRENLETIKRIAHEIDPGAEVFLFGSVAEGKYNYSSDIDMLVITKSPAAGIHLELWRAGIKEPFEIHVQPPEKAQFHKNGARLLKI